ncbi:unnamed protein product [Notodromas monacha]|uniref:Angiotensin-converting enzyme n=1 Tax=Notodromas monacha TaxID=399045 RepID=A0A7R9GCE1_9CRUS|nr:unnamed protein product [Notodromas monacha]CAG0917330.1 unnamed protein product [Notodromas monacha]
MTVTSATCQPINPKLHFQMYLGDQQPSHRESASATSCRSSTSSSSSSLLTRAWASSGASWLRFSHAVTSSPRSRRLSSQLLFAGVALFFLHQLVLDRANRPLQEPVSSVASTPSSSLIDTNTVDVGNNRRHDVVSVGVGDDEDRGDAEEEVIATPIKASVEELREYMRHYNKILRMLISKRTRAEWAFQTNTTDENLMCRLKGFAKLTNWQTNEWEDHISLLDWSILKTVDEPELRRMYEFVSDLGSKPMEREKVRQRNILEGEMTETYKDAEVCPFNNQHCDPHEDETWRLEQSLKKELKRSQTRKGVPKMEYIWRTWRDLTGKKVRNQFIEYVRLSKEIVDAMGDPKIKTQKDLWLEAYESPEIEFEVHRIYEELRPFYFEFHAFVRHRLSLHYGKDIVDPKGLIPSHLLGNLWAQKWHDSFGVVSEFPKALLDVTPNLQKLNYTVKRMFEVGDQFFTGLGLIGLEEGSPDCLQLSMLERPRDGRRVNCYNDAKDFMLTDQLPGDFRIIQCASVNHADLILAHHQLGHIQYFMQYVQQPPIFREAAMPGILDAISEALTMSVSTAKHLKSIGLLEEHFRQDMHTQLAFLMREALEKIPFLPYAYLMDLYRWKVFNGSIPIDRMNAEWWKIGAEFQGIKPPVPRTEEDFDPGAKVHFLRGTSYIRFFLAKILQYTLHQALCEAAGQFDPSQPELMPLHECDISGSRAAGHKLMRLMQAGSSKHWKDLLFELTGSRELSAKPVLNYFVPLRKYIRGYIAAHRVHVGWPLPSDSAS